MMDLVAYSNIDNLKQLAEMNGISIPRLRGYTLMTHEQKCDLRQVVRDIEVLCCDDLCEKLPRFSIHSNCYGKHRSATRLKNKYMVIAQNSASKEDPDYIAVRWDRIHGKKRKMLKRYINMKKKSTLAQCSAWNKYCGRPDVLCIHARIGGLNWEPYGGKELEKMPWFLEKADDYYDSTYCDIYARIDELRNTNEVMDK